MSETSTHRIPAGDIFSEDESFALTAARATTKAARKYLWLMLPPAAVLFATGDWVDRTYGSTGSTLEFYVCFALIAAAFLTWHTTVRAVASALVSSTSVVRTVKQDVWSHRVVMPKEQDLLTALSLCAGRPVQSVGRRFDGKHVLVDLHTAGRPTGTVVVTECR